MKHDLSPMMHDDWLQASCVGDVSEITDGETPNAARGCPCQAWSLAELLRLDRIVLAEKKDVRTQSAPHNI